MMSEYNVNKWKQIADNLGIDYSGYSSTSLQYEETWIRIVGGNAVGEALDDGAFIFTKEQRINVKVAELPERNKLKGLWFFGYDSQNQVVKNFASENNFMLRGGDVNPNTSSPNGDYFDGVDDYASMDGQIANSTDSGYIGGITTILNPTLNISNTIYIDNSVWHTVGFDQMRIYGRLGTSNNFVAASPSVWTDEELNWYLKADKATNTGTVAVKRPTSTDFDIFASGTDASYDFTLNEILVSTYWNISYTESNMKCLYVYADSSSINLDVNNLHTKLQEIIAIVEE